MDMMFHNLTITDADFQRLVQFMQKNYGIDLSKKKQLITSPSRPRAIGISNPFWSIFSPPRTPRTWSWCSIS